MKKLAFLDLIKYNDPKGKIGEAIFCVVSMYQIDGDICIASIFSSDFLTIFSSSYNGV